MRLPIALLIMAVAFTWLQFTVTARVGAAHVVAAERRQAPQRSPGPRVTAVGERQIPRASVAAPLFRPAQPPSADTAPRPGETFLLIGLAGADAARVAYVRDVADGRSWRLRRGDHADDWTAERIEEHCIVLTRGRRRQNVCL